MICIFISLKVHPFKIVPFKTPHIDSIDIKMREILISKTIRVELTKIYNIHIINKMYSHPFPKLNLKSIY